MVFIKKQIFYWLIGFISQLNIKRWKLIVTYKHLAHRSTYNDTNKTRHRYAWQCHYCLNCYGRKGKYERHFEHCSGVTGIFCNFDTQHSVTFEDNLQYKGNSHLLAYCDFEITVLTDSGSDPEIKFFFAVSYVIIFVFHPELNLDCVTIERSLGHSSQKLTHVSYLTRTHY